MMSFIYVGRLDELKGIKVLFESWKMIGKCGPELKVCGDGPLDDWCRLFIKSNDLPNIKMLGRVNNNSVKRLMSESDALIMPSLCYEGFPMTIVEAYSVGVPVIGSDIGNIGCLIESGITGWKFKPISADELEKTIYLALNQKEKIKKKISKYKELYNAEKNYQILIEIYERVRCVY